jgi:hypothetical protein
LFHDGFVARSDKPAQAAGPPGCPSVKSLQNEEKRAADAVVSRVLTVVAVGLWLDPVCVN